MGMIDYHKRHEAYVAAVADALASAGFASQYHFADANDPRDGAVELDLEQIHARFGPSVWSHDEVSVCWQEDRGWYVVTVDDPHGRDSRFAYDLGVERIASPATVVVAVAEQAGVNVEVAADSHPDVDFAGHNFDDGDDNGVPEFEAALLHYIAAPA
jgi:hypothetical protein